MATQLKNIVNFVNVAPAATVALPHDLNIDGRQVRPDLVAPSVAGFNVTVDAVNVTVTNTNPNVASVDVYVECWHTIERVFGDVATLELAPRPFILSPGGTGGGNPINVEDEGALVGVRPTLNFIGGAVTAADDIPNNRVNVTITATSLTGNPPTQIDIGDVAVVGVATDAARADHQHALPTPGNPTDVDANSVAAPGASTIPARADHQHGALIGDPITVRGDTNADGVADEIARSDHRHRLELEVLDSEEPGVLVGARPAIHFMGAGVTVTDNPAEDHVDVVFSPAPNDTLLTWGNANVGAAADTRFLCPGRDNTGIALVVDVCQIPAPREGTLRRLYVRHNTAGGNGNSVVYTVMVNGVATGITVTIPTGAVGQVSDLINTAAVVVGDRVSLRATKALGLAGGLVDVQASLEIGY